jgi:L-methionine (R)-S-oxide reductase
MAENLFIPTTANRAEKYEAILPQIEALISGETDLIANLANITAVLKETFGFFWIGFYIRRGNELVLGPFQGTLACTRIPFHKGVCGACYTERKTMLVPDVEAFPNHIACSSASKSEIVVPIFDTGRQDVLMVLDIDSDMLDDFSTTDQLYLERLADIITKTVVV